MAGFDLFSLCSANPCSPTPARSDSPKPMSNFNQPPPPIGWHLNGGNPKSTPVKKYRPLTSNSPLAMEDATSITNNNDSPSSFLARYQQLKDLEGYKNNLIEELLYRNETVCEQYKKAVEERDAEIEYNCNARRREKTYEANLNRLQFLMNRDPFVLVLVDGNATIFREDLIAQGENGGGEAARLLESHVKDYLSQALPDLPEDTRIVVRVFADLKALGDNCQQAGLIGSAPKIQQFTRGFTRGHSLFDFVDVGSDSQASVLKLSEIFKLYLNDFHCRQILFGCSNDNEYVCLLQEAALDEHTLSRVTLLEGEPFGSGIKDLPFDTVSFPTFESAKDVLLPTSRHDIPLSRQLSNLDLDEIKDFTPSIPPAAIARPIVAPTSSTASPANMWAAIAAKPAAPIIPPPASASATPQPAAVAKQGDSIVKNRKGQRIDPVIKHDKVEVDRVKKLKMCNTHYLRGSCPAPNCPHVHTYKPTAIEVNTLRLVARMAPCMNGADCEDAKCIYGHVCPAPEHREGRLTKDGKDCIFLEDCRFPGTMHLRGEDRKEVKFIKV